jgi:hypothetical protein
VHLLQIDGSRRTLLISQELALRMDGQFTWRSRAHSVKVSLFTARSPHPEYSPRIYDVSPRPKPPHTGHDVNIIAVR